MVIAYFDKIQNLSYIETNIKIKKRVKMICIHNLSNENKTRL